MRTIALTLLIAAGPPPAVPDHVPRQHASWNVATLDVRQFGAVPDDAVDDTAAFQTAIDAAASARKTLAIPEGVFRVSATLTVPSKATIQCASHNSELVFQNAAGMTGVAIAGASDVTIERCKLRGSMSPPSATHLVSIVKGSAKIALRRVWLEGGGATGPNPMAAVRIEGGEDIEITDSVLTGNGPPPGVVAPFSNVVVVNWSGGAKSHSRRFRFERNRVYGNTAVYPLSMCNVSDAKIIDNAIDQGNNLGKPLISGYGILVYALDGASEPLKGNQITGNHVINTAGSGIYTQGAVHSIIANNVVRNCVRQQSDELLSVGCISVSAGYKSAPKASSIVLAGNVVDGSGKSGISIANGEGVTITGNTIAHAGTNGIQLITSNKDVVLTGNTVSDSAGHGLLLKGANAGITISENIIDGAKTGIADYVGGDTASLIVVHNQFSGCDAAMQFAAGSDVQIQGNLVARAAGAEGGAIEWGGRDSLIAENVISDPAGTGIHLRSTSRRTRASGNVVRNAGRYGIVDSGTGNTIANNILTSNRQGPYSTGSSTAAHGNRTTDDGALAGRVRLADGKATVRTTEIRAGDEVRLTRQRAGTSPGHLSTSSLVAGESFVIRSTSSRDDGEVAWEICH